MAEPGNSSLLNFVARNERRFSRRRKRPADALPRGWIKRMKLTTGLAFQSERMVMDHTPKCYVPAAGGT
jgi:hypothetical protein